MERERRHLEGVEACPHLPAVDRVLGSDTTRRFRRGERGEAFYEAALAYAQSLWLQGYPAKSLLLINRAMGAALDGDEAVLARWPVPYEAAAWVMVNRPDGQFIGNPRRHYQHLATRMVEPRKVQRTWRAWACRMLSDIVFEAADYPEDERQIREEGVVVPGVGEVLERLGACGWPGEVAVWERAAAIARGEIS